MGWDISAQSMEPSARPLPNATPVAVQNTSQALSTTSSAKDSFYQRYFRKGQVTQEPEDYQKDKLKKQLKSRPRPLGTPSTPEPELDPREKEIRELIYDLGAESHRRNSAVERLAVIGKPAVPALQRALRDSYAFTRIGALNALTYIHAEETIKDIQRCLQDREPDVRAEAVKSLGRMRHRDSALVVAERLHDPERRVRREATIALGRLAPNSIARRNLLKALTHADPEVRQQAAQELPAFPGADVVDALLKATYDSDYATCAMAVRGLGELGAGKARTRLKSLARSPNARIREEALQALQSIPAMP